MAIEDKQIDTTVDVPPIKSGGRLSVNDIMGMEAPFLRKKAELSSEATKAKGEELQAKQTQAETEATGVSEAFQKGAQQERQAREQYKSEMAANPLPAFVPSKEDAGDLGLLFTLTNILGFAVGAKGNSQAALSAMNGMLEGHRKGREDLYKKEKDEFDKNFKVLVEKQKTLRKEMEDAIKLMQTDKEAGQQAAHLAAIRSGSDIIKAQVSQGRYTDAYNQVQDNQKVAENALSVVEKQREKDLEYSRQTQLEKLKLTAATARKDQKQLDALGPQLRNMALEYPDGTAATLVGASPTDKNRIYGSYRAIQQSEEVADFVAKNKDAVGVLAVIKNALRMDAIKSIQNEDENKAAQDKSTLVDNAIDKAAQSGQITADAAQNAKVLQKKLFSLALADVQSSGQRGSVFLDRKFQDLYDQASRPETLLEVIKQREQENNGNLQAYGLNVERHNNPQLFPLHQANTPELFTNYVKERAPQKIASKADIEETAKQTGLTIAETKEKLKAKGFKIEEDGGKDGWD